MNAARIGFVIIKPSKRDSKTRSSSSITSQRLDFYTSFRLFGLQGGRRRDDGEKEGVGRHTLRGAEKARQALHRTGGERWVHIRRLHCFFIYMRCCNESATVRIYMSALNAILVSSEARELVRSIGNNLDKKYKPRPTAHWDHCRHEKENDSIH